MGRGVRLLRRGPEAARADGAEGVRRVAAGVPRAERAARRGRDRLSSTATTSALRCRRSRGSSFPSCVTATHAPSRSCSATSSARGGRARGTLKPEELRGSTFTVTSAGKLAGLFQTPIVNHPEVAILSIGRIAEGRSCATASRGRRRSATSLSRSTTVSSTAPARPSSASTSSVASSRAVAARSQRTRGAPAPGQWRRGVPAIRRGANGLRLGVRPRDAGRASPRSSARWRARRCGRRRASLHEHECRHVRP